MGRRELGCQHGFDLRSEFDFQFVQPGLRQKLGHTLEPVEIAHLIHQGGHLVPGSERPPPILGTIAEGCQVYAEGNSGMFCEQMHGV